MPGDSGLGQGPGRWNPFGFNYTPEEYRHVGRVLELVDAPDLAGDHEAEDLVPARLGDGIQGIEGVHLGEGAVLARPVRDLGEDPAEARELRDAAVHELGLAEDLERAVALVADPPRARRVLREAERVEAHVADERAVERRRRPGQRDRRVLRAAARPLLGLGRGLGALLAEAEAGRRRREAERDDELHSQRAN